MPLRSFPLHRPNRNNDSDDLEEVVTNSTSYCKYCKNSGKIDYLFTRGDCICVDKKGSGKEKFKSEWSLSEGLNFIRRLEEKLIPYEFTSSIGGGVIFKGFSNKDLDIFISPWNKDQCDFSRITPKVFEELGGKIYKNFDECKKDFEYFNDDQEPKYLEIWDFDGKRVDFFFVS